MKMPEEINRILTDRISDYLFVTEKSGLENLKKEGTDASKIFFVGNTMIDSLVYYSDKIIESDILERLKINPEDYALVTMHRPSNVDEEKSLIKLTDFLNEIARYKKIVFPVHPRTENNLEKFSLKEKLSPEIILTKPIGYIDFQALVKNAAVVITDSGGIQEETTYLKVQCITLRDSTERPSTVEIGTNQLIGADFEAAEKAALKILNGHKKQGSVPPLWDGKAAERIAKVLITDYC